MPYQYTCSECQTDNVVETEDSITTWLYPELVQKILDDGYYFECKNCGVKNKIFKQILVNARKGMFMMDTSASLEIKKQQLIDYGVIDENGNILNQTKLRDLDVKHDPLIAPIVEAISKEVKDFKDNLLEEEDDKKNS